MNTKRNILIAFILNLAFSAFELFGGIVSGSTAIMSDAVHDLGDAISIGVSFFLERRSKKGSDKFYTFGYARYSILGSVITTLFLLVGSCAVVYNAVSRLIYPVAIQYNEMMIFAVVGVMVNALAALATREGDSLNQRAVNLHMLEDVLGWLAVLVAAVIMKFTNFAVLDAIVSIAVSVFILLHAIKHLYSSVEILLEKCPRSINVIKLENEISSLDGVVSVKSLRVWSLDESNVLATAHVVADDEHTNIKAEIKKCLRECGVTRSTVELCNGDELEYDKKIEPDKHCYHHHHHHHH